MAKVESSSKPEDEVADKAAAEKAAAEKAAADKAAADKAAAESKKDVLDVVVAELCPNKQWVKARKVEHKGHESLLEVHVGNNAALKVGDKINVRPAGAGRWARG